MVYLFFSLPAPCAPQNVVSELDCLSNFLTVRWNISRGAAFYLVAATGPEGPVNTCNTTAQQCKLQTLRCSSSYNVSVIAVNQQCNTSGGSILEINTGTVSIFVSSAVSFISIKKEKKRKKKRLIIQHANKITIWNISVWKYYDTDMTVGYILNGNSNNVSQVLYLAI